MKVFFLHNNKKYSFDISIFIKYSDYISRKYEEMHKNKTYFLNLISDFDNCPDLQDDIINTFIDYCQDQKIELSIHNVFPLKFLSTKYNVYTLTEMTEKYIQDHYLEIINDFLSTSNPGNHVHSYYEEIISRHIFLYLDDDRLLNIPVPSLYRIIEKYKIQHSNQNKVDNDEFPFIQFLTKYIQKNGPQISILLKLFELGPKSCEYLTEKLSENPDFIDSNLSKSLMFRSIHFMQIKQKEKENLNEQKSSFESIRVNCVAMFDELFQTKALNEAIVQNNNLNFPMSLMKYGAMYAIRSIFNDTNSTDEFSPKDEKKNKDSKFDFLNELLKQKQFSEQRSILLENKVFSEIISLVSTIQSKRTKKSVANLFKLIENKNDCIEFVDKVFPYYHFENSEFSVITFWIPLLKELIVNKIHFSVTVDGEEFVFNESPMIKCKVILAMNEKNSLSLSKGSQIQFDYNDECIQLDVKNDELVYYVLLELTGRKMKTAGPIKHNEIFHAYFLDANKKFLKQKPKENHILSIKDLFQRTDDSILSMMWNLVFTLTEAEIHDISNIINPYESHLLLMVLKMFKASNVQNIKDILAWNKWAERIDSHIIMISKCIMKKIPQDENISNNDINLLINDIGKGIEYLKMEPALEGFIESSTKIIDVLTNEFNRFSKMKSKKEEICEMLNKIINDLRAQKIIPECEKMRNEIIKELSNIKIYSYQKCIHSSQIVKQFIHCSQSFGKEKEDDQICWPDIEINENDAKEKNIQLFESLIFYSKVKFLLEEIQKSSNIIMNLIKLNDYPEMNESIKSYLTCLIQSIEEKDNESSLKLRIENALYTMQANMIMKLYKNNDLFIKDLEYLCNTIDSYADRNAFYEKEVEWMDNKIKELSSDFLLQIPKFDPNSLVFLIINEVNDNRCIAGPLFSEISDLNLSFIESQSDLMFNKFYSFRDAAKSIAQVFYNSIFSSDEVPPQNYDEIKEFYHKPFETDENIIEIINRIKILFQIAESLDSWEEPNLKFDDVFFLSNKWKDLIVNNDMLNEYPSFLFWICQNKKCTLQLMSKYHNYSPVSNQIPLWLVYLRIVSSKRCIRFDSDVKTKASNMINKAITERIYFYLSDSKNQIKGINYNWLNILASRLPKRIQNLNIKIYHDFLSFLSMDNLENQSLNFQDSKYQHIYEITYKLVSLILEDKYQKLLDMEISNVNSLMYFICYPSKYIKNKIKDSLS